MLKLYRFSQSKKEYWETWEEDGGSHVIHWGELGSHGESRTIDKTSPAVASQLLQQEIESASKDGFAPFHNHILLVIQYEIDGMGTTEDLDKRFRLQQRMDNTLGWTGLGACDGGSTGSGTMEVCNWVVDFELAKSVVIADLAETEFANYTRICAESSESNP